MLGTHPSVFIRPLDLVFWHWSSGLDPRWLELKPRPLMFFISPQTLVLDNWSLVLEPSASMLGLGPHPSVLGVGIWSLGVCSSGLLLGCLVFKVWRLELEVGVWVGSFRPSVSSEVRPSEFWINNWSKDFWVSCNKGIERSEQVQSDSSRLEQRIR